MAGAAATLVALVSGGIVDAAIVLAAIIAIQQLEGNVFYPMVVGKRLQLHPVAILLALTAGGVLAGVAGAFLAIPVAAVTSAVLDYMRTRRRERGLDALVAPRRLGRHGRGDAGVLRAARARSTTTGGSGRACSRRASGRAGTRTSPRCRRRWPRWRPRARSTSPAAPASSRATCRARSPGSTRAPGCSRSRARGMPDATFVRGDALDPPFDAGAFERVHAGHFYGHLVAGAADGLPRAGGAARGRARDHRLGAAPRRASPRPGRSASSTTARATASTSAGSRPRGSRRSSAAARPCTTAPGSSPCAERLSA